MAKITSFRELIVWQKSMDLAERCYRISKRFKKEGLRGFEWAFLVSD